MQSNAGVNASGEGAMPDIMSMEEVRQLATVASLSDESWGTGLAITTRRLCATVDALYSVLRQAYDGDESGRPEGLGDACRCWRCRAEVLLAQLERTAQAGTEADGVMRS